MMLFYKLYNLLNTNTKYVLVKVSSNYYRLHKVYKLNDTYYLKLKGTMFSYTSYEEVKHEFVII